MVNGGWMHVVAPIDPTGAGLDQITGVVLKMWSGDPASGQTGTATFWLDNVKLMAKTNQTVAGPTLSIEPAQPGLRLFASAQDRSISGRIFGQSARITRGWAPVMR